MPESRLTEFPGAGPLQSGTRVRVAHYFMELREDFWIRKFCVVGATGPQHVETRAPDGTVQKWKQREEGDLLCFYPPDGYRGGPLAWVYDYRLQDGQAIPREELEKRCLRGRVSVEF